MGAVLSLDRIRDLYLFQARLKFSSRGEQKRWLGEVFLELAAGQGDGEVTGASMEGENHTLALRDSTPEQRMEGVKMAYEWLEGLEAGDAGPAAKGGMFTVLWRGSPWEVLGRAGEC